MYPKWNYITYFPNVSLHIPSNFLTLKLPGNWFLSASMHFCKNVWQYIIQHTYSNIMCSRLSSYTKTEYYSRENRSILTWLRENLVISNQRNYCTPFCGFRQAFPAFITAFRFMCPWRFYKPINDYHLLMIWVTRESRGYLTFATVWRPQSHAAIQTCS